MRDKITEALVLLRDEDGFEILEHVPCCHDCAVYGMVDEGLGATDPFCFYTEKDLAMMSLGETYLSWGSVEADAELIVRRLREAGLEPSWDGQRGHRVHVRLP